MSTPSLMHIGELADKAGVSTRTLRFYEQQGILQPVVRTERGVRIYSEDQMRTLKLIQLLKILGFNLKKIKSLITDSDLGFSGRGTAEKMREVLSNHIEQLDGRIREYQNAKTELERAYGTLEDCLSCPDEVADRNCPCEEVAARLRDLVVIREIAN